VILPEHLGKSVDALRLAKGIAIRRAKSAIMPFAPSSGQSIKIKNWQFPRRGTALI
jgi:hypothetical protein